MQKGQKQIITFLRNEISVTVGEHSSVFTARDEPEQTHTPPHLMQHRKVSQLQTGADVLGIRSRRKDCAAEEKQPGWGKCSRCKCYRELNAGEKSFFRKPRYCDCCQREIDEAMK